MNDQNEALKKNKFILVKETVNNKVINFFSFNGKYIKVYNSCKEINMIINSEYCKVFNWKDPNSIAYNGFQTNINGDLLYDEEYEIKDETLDGLITKLEIIIRQYKPNKEYANEVYWNVKDYFYNNSLIAVKFGIINKNIYDPSIFSILNILKDFSILKNFVNTGEENSMLGTELIKLINNTTTEIHCDDLVYERLYSFKNIDVLYECINELNEIKNLLY
jgi:hypothetical protein